MKERPILFSGEMVRAILDGRKTQTRRVVKPQPLYQGISKMLFETHPFAPSSFKGTVAEGISIAPEQKVWVHEDWCGNIVGIQGLCPYGSVGDSKWNLGMPPVSGYYYVKGEFENTPVYLRPCFAKDYGTERDFITWGQDESDDPEDLSTDGGSTPETIKWKRPGDRLWVRETFAHTLQLNLHPEDENYGFVYRATAPEWGDEIEGWQWKPSIHMPRIASRITLEIVSVRVERLQDISEEDVLSEGTPGAWVDFEEEGYKPNSNGAKVRKFFFQKLWEDINGAESWEANPWVWVIEFRRVEK